MALKQAAAAQQQLTILLEIMDKYRGKINEEINRHHFFEVGQDIYDLGIDLAFSQLHDEPQAFAIAEASRARSLLDSMQAGAQMIAPPGRPGSSPRTVTAPLPLTKIQAHIPDRARLLYYAVIGDKLLIWVL